MTVLRFVITNYIGIFAKDIWKRAVSEEQCPIEEKKVREIAEILSPQVLNILCDALSNQSGWPKDWRINLTGFKVRLLDLPFFSQNYHYLLTSLVSQVSHL